MKPPTTQLEHLSSCPVCSSNAISPYRKATFDYHHLNTEHLSLTNAEYGTIWDLSRCRDCQHIFANPTPSPDFIQSLYRETEDPLYEDEARGRSKNFQRILTLLERFNPSKGTLFDVGAATGILLDIARERGWSPEGIEASSWAVEVAREKYNLRLQEGSFETARLRASSCSVVTMIDFIEHTPRPLEAMIKAHEILSPSGTLCVVTPDVESLATRLMDGKWWHFRPAHLAYFNQNSIHTLLGRAGFRILKERKYSWTFSAHYLLSRINALKFLVRNPRLAVVWRKIPVRLALFDSVEIYARKEQ